MHSLRDRLSNTFTLMTGMALGASMPMRTVDPETSTTSMTTSSPSMTFSPGLRVMMSIGRLLLGAVVS